METITYEQFLRRVPKLELHCHFEGTVRAATFAELARKHGISLPTDDTERLYDYDSIYEFLQIFGLVSSTLIDRDDFARAAFESIEDGVTLGNLKYREMFFNPTLRTSRGVRYPVVVDGLIDGITEAERRFGVRCRLIADVYRQDPPQQAAEMVREVLDHGYHVLDDPELVKRVRDEGIVLTTCPTATAVCYFGEDLTAHPIIEMERQGLRITLNSDDPTMFATDIGEEFVRMTDAAHWKPAQIRRFCTTAVDAAWMPDDDKRAMRREVERELDELEAALAPEHP